MSVTQTIASKRFISAMGSMVEDEKMLNEVLGYIEYIKLRPAYPQITQAQLDANGMPLHEAMDQLRAKARAFYQV